MAYISDNQITSLVHRLIHLVVWVITAVAQAVIIILVLLAMILFEVSGNDIYNLIIATGQHLGLETAQSILSFFGVSGFTILSGYIYFSRKFVIWFSLSYLWKHIDERNIK